MSNVPQIVHKCTADNCPWEKTLQRLVQLLDGNGHGPLVSRVEELEKSMEDHNLVLVGADKNSGIQGDVRDIKSIGRTLVWIIATAIALAALTATLMGFWLHGVAAQHKIGGTNGPTLAFHQQAGAPIPINESVHYGR